MKPTFKHHPEHYSYTDLLVSFANGKPLSCEQLNFIYRHEKSLSTHGLDPLLKYYLKPYYDKHATHHSFLTAYEKLNVQELDKLKNRLRILLDKKGSRVQFQMTPKEFLEFKHVTYQELILYHGNQFLTGAPFYPGGIPHTIYFQWGNLFGVAKYVMLPEERALKSNVLIYFEDRYERSLDECVLQYNAEHQLDVEKQNQLNLQLQKQAEQHTEQLRHTYSPFNIPKLTLSKYDAEREKETK